MPPSSSNQVAGLKKMLKLTNSLLSRNDAAPFAEPVDWRGLELWDYPQIITKMMDLGTVKRKLERNLYRNHAECAADIRLIWSNCQLYNEEGSDFWHLSKMFSKKFEDRYKKMLAEFGDPTAQITAAGATSATTASASAASNDSSSSSKNKLISMDRKSKFASLIFRLNGMELGHVIQTLEVSCPEVLEDIDVVVTTNVTDNANANSSSNSISTSQVEVNVDAIPTDVFEKLEEYLAEKVPPATKKRKL